MSGRRVGEWMSWKRLDVTRDAMAIGTLAAAKTASEAASAQAGASRNAALFDVTMWTPGA